MQYVDNLLKCQPDDILPDYTPNKILAIVPLKERTPSGMEVVVVWEDGHSSTYTKDGRCVCHGRQNFVYKPRIVKRLKPLHVILAENTYSIENDYVRFADGHMERMEPLFKQRGNEKSELVRRGWFYLDCFFDEVEE